LAESMGKQGRKRIKEQFSADVMAQSIQKLYSELLTRKGITADV